MWINRLIKIHQSGQHTELPRLYSNEHPESLCTKIDLFLVCPTATHTSEAVGRGKEMRFTRTKALRAVLAKRELTFPNISTGALPSLRWSSAVAHLKTEPRGWKKPRRMSPLSNSIASERSFRSKNCRSTDGTRTPGLMTHSLSGMFVCRHQAPDVASVSSHRLTRQRPLHHCLI